MNDSVSAKGVEIIRARALDLPEKPGVYRMETHSGVVLYVGKAKNIKKRVLQYTQVERLPLRLQRMVFEVERLEWTPTRTEAEALLLEANQIKNLKPKYNILLKDDKSFPYITLTSDHDFPRITKHRGQKNPDHAYFGPFASAHDVNHAITTLQKAFLLRPCADTVFHGRTRTCLEYQIKRCSGPCVGKISKQAYQGLVREAEHFLAGKGGEILEGLQKKMASASQELRYEEAASYRDRIKALASIQAKQTINTKDFESADIIALYREDEWCVVQVAFVRAYQTLGYRSFFPAQIENVSDGEVLEAFMGRFYQSHEPPPLILLSHTLPSSEVMEEALALKAGPQPRVKILYPKRTEKREFLERVLQLAKEALTRHKQEQESERVWLNKLSQCLGMEESINRIEVYDNSHIMGKFPVGAMIVATPEGFASDSYRRYNVHSGDKETGGNDLVMMSQMLRRRLLSLIEKDPDRQTNEWPDLLLIDGGEPQLREVRKVQEDLGVSDILCLAIAKGEKRNAGREWFHMEGRPPFQLSHNDPLLHYLQRLRDEAHRFAITSHRNKRKRDIRRSKLDSIPGIGLVRKKALLQHFGSAAAVENASIAELMRVSGISRKMAQEIHDYLHLEN